MDQKQRQSGIELLRLVAMFGIVLSHWGGHGSWVVNNDNTFIVNKVFLQLTQYFGEIGNCVFVLITGYFCANNIEVNKKGVLRVITDVKVYAILMFVISICIGMTEFSISGGGKMFTSNCLSAILVCATIFGGIVAHSMDKPNHSKV